MPQDLGRELFQPLGPWPLEYLRGCTGLHNAPPVHKDDTACHLTHERHLVADDDHRHTIRCKLADRIENFRHKLRVQRCGNLIEQQDRRFLRERSGNRDALLLATGELVGIGSQLFCQADTREEFLRFPHNFRSWTLLHDLGCQRNVPERRHVLEKVVLLENDGEAVTRFPQGGAVSVADGLSVKRHGALGGLGQADQGAQQRALARAGRPDQRDHFPAVDRQRNIAEDLFRAVVRANAIEFQKRHCPVLEYV